MAKKKSKAGRPTVMTPTVIAKLETAFSLDSTVLEACFYAGISKDSYYDFLKDNPEYSDRFEALRNKPVLKARETVYKALGTPQYATWYLERKAKKEFATRTEHTGAEGEALNKPVLTDEEKEKLFALLKRKKK